MSDITDKPEKNSGAKVKTKRKRGFWWILTMFLIAGVLGAVHSYYVAYIFELNRDYRHLSQLEREMSMRTEMGFYYSYYKTIVEENQLIGALTRITSDKYVEYPDEVNAFNRFNIYPEVIIGSLYRYVKPWLENTVTCDVVLRGDDIESVYTCNGAGEPMTFYLMVIWVMAGVSVASLFVYGTVLSKNLLGGLMTVIQYLANHEESTRVMWAPNERENLAQPLLLLQMCLVTLQLRRTRDKKASLGLQVSIFVLNCLCLLFWQFSQFIFLTQIAILFVMEQVQLIDLKSLCIFLHSHFCGLHTAVLLLQGNDMLKSSLYASFFLVVSMYCLFFSNLRVEVENRLTLVLEIILVIVRIGLVVVFSFYLKKVISEFLGVEEDTHIWDVLMSKFSDFKNFHTLLYTCSEVFDFLPKSTWYNIWITYLLPINIIVIGNTVIRWTLRAVSRIERKSSESTEKSMSESENGSDSGIENFDSGNTDATDIDKIDETIKKTKMAEQDMVVTFLENLRIDAGIFYNVSQMVVFGFMAVIIMRLKLLFVPHLCIVASLAADMKLYQVTDNFKWAIRFIILPTLYALVIAAIIGTVRSETSHIVDYTDLPQEEMLRYVISQTPAHAVLAGPMPLMASVLLSARRAVVCHPHYEHKGARDRTYTVYKTYGRFSSQDLYQELSKMKVSHLILDKNHCYEQSSQNCTLDDIWRVEAPELASNPRLCETLTTELTDHFYKVFDNSAYTIFKIHDYSLRYMPRILDT